jgi:N-acylneuraminate cytidylyltransferase
MSTKRTIAIIPARGGSERIPKKNIREFRGRPLIAYTIDAALGSAVFDRVVVSTDDEAIAAVAEEHGAEVPFRRPETLADNHTPVSEATAHALASVDPEGGRYDHVAQLMANCPLRTGSDIQDSYKQFQDSGADAQLSVFEFGWQNPWWALKMNDDGKLKPLFEIMFEEGVRSQDQPSLYCVTGAVWWAKSTVLRTHQTFHIAGRKGWTIPRHRAVDIDTEEDWHLAEVLAEAASNGDKQVSS